MQSEIRSDCAPPMRLRGWPGSCLDNRVVRTTNDKVKSASGFTLLELMVVVVIVSVLATVAVPAFSSYVNKSRANEGPAFLAEIKGRQESYRAEFGQYCDTSGSMSYGGTWAPRATPDKRVQGWTAPTAQWAALAANPNGPLRFIYQSPAGLPGQAVPATAGALYDGDEFWFTAQARGDLDADGMLVTFEIYSAANQVVCSSARGWE